MDAPVFGAPASGSRQRATRSPIRFPVDDRPAESSSNERRRDDESTRRRDDRHVSILRETTPEEDSGCVWTDTTGWTTWSALADKRKRTQAEAEEFEVEVVARKMKVKMGGVQAEMSSGATMRKAEVKKDAVRSGRRPELGDEWEGRQETFVKWGNMSRAQRKSCNRRMRQIAANGHPRTGAEDRKRKKAAAAAAAAASSAEANEEGAMEAAEGDGGAAASGTAATGVTTDAMEESEQAASSAQRAASPTPSEAPSTSITPSMRRASVADEEEAENPEVAAGVATGESALDGVEAAVDGTPRPNLTINIGPGHKRIKTQRPYRPGLAEGERAAEADRIRMGKEEWDKRKAERMAKEEERKKRLAEDDEERKRERARRYEVQFDSEIEENEDEIVVTPTVTFINGQRVSSSDEEDWDDDDDDDETEESDKKKRRWKGKSAKGKKTYRKGGKSTKK